MNRDVRKTVALALMLSLAGLASAGVCSAQDAAPKPTLADTDCVKCHVEQPADVLKAGEAHREDIGCQDCHEGHRPSSEKNIPECSNCHEGESHFELKGCLGCHTNPHTPLIITIAKGVTDPCLTCHDEQIAQLQTNKSKHTAQACSNCHDVHGKIPECIQCHKPHSEQMTQADCGKCHQAHQPTMVAYDDKVPNKDCGSCHKTPLALLSASPTKHGEKACVFCHKAKHQAVAPCTECHGEKPHPEAILAKFKKCGDCHYIAHDLNNWAAAEKAAAKKK